MDTKRVATIGIPVFQGENYLDHALSAARAQDYDALEIVVSDNASTDGTAAIVERHAAEDDRVRLLRQSRNLGAAENYNQVFRVAEGAYFAWNAHDDFSSSDFVSSGVEALKRHPRAVVAIGRPYWVDAVGQKLEAIPVPEGLDSPSPARRFRSAARGAPAALVFGLYRADLVARSHLHEGFTGSDRNFVAEMMLYGEAVLAADAEFYLREHPERSVRRLHKSESGRPMAHNREAWYAPDRGGRIVFPAWRRLRGYLRAVLKAPLTARERWACLASCLLIVFDDRLNLLREMIRDLVVAGFTGWQKVRPTQAGQT